MQRTESPEMQEVLQTQKAEANTEFFKFISKQYAGWIQEPASAPVMSHTLLRNKVIPQLEKEVPLFFILIDNLRFDQWKAIEPVLLQNFRRTEEDSFYSILPTATQYARNAIFSGLLPVEMQKQYPQYFKHDEEEGGKNLFEEELLRTHLRDRCGCTTPRWSIINRGSSCNNRSIT